MGSVSSFIVRKFECLAPYASDTPKLNRLRHLIDYFVCELDCDEGPPSDLALAEFEQMIMLAFLTANRHNYRHLPEGEPFNTGRGQVRLVEKYIKSNWNKLLSVEALAEATGAGI